MVNVPFIRLRPGTVPTSSFQHPTDPTREQNEAEMDDDAFFLSLRDNLFIVLEADIFDEGSGSFSGRL
jgi:hypothetical protein